MLCFISLANCAAADELLNQLVVMWREECGAEAVECLLDTLVPHATGLLDDHRP
jgi:hypothetical protein